MIELQAKSHYAFAACSCGWSEDATEDVTAEELLARHPDECESPMRHLMVPMWSIAWPYYWSDASVAHREGRGDPPPFGLEMAWRPAGSHTTRFPTLQSGMDPKVWWLFNKEPTP